MFVPTGDVLEAVRRDGYYQSRVATTPEDVSSIHRRAGEFAW